MISIRRGARVEKMGVKGRWVLDMGEVLKNACIIYIKILDISIQNMVNCLSP